MSRKPSTGCTHECAPSDKRTTSCSSSARPAPLQLKRRWRRPGRFPAYALRRRCEAFKRRHQFAGAYIAFACGSRDGDRVVVNPKYIRAQPPSSPMLPLTRLISHVKRNMHRSVHGVDEIVVGSPIREYFRTGHKRVTFTKPTLET